MTFACQDCGAAAEPDFRFCINCGSELTHIQVCGSCKAKIHPDYRFCVYCGIEVLNANHVTGADKTQTHVALQPRDKSPPSAITDDAMVATGSGEAATPSRDIEAGAPPTHPIPRHHDYVTRSFGGRLAITRRFRDQFVAFISLPFRRSGSFATFLRRTDLWQFDEFASMSDRTRIAIEFTTVSLIVFLALCLRVADLGSIPAGFNTNEAELAVEATKLLNGEWIGVWSPIQWGIPSGFLHWQALIFTLAEPSVFWARFGAALPGTAMIPGAYLLIRRYFPFRVAVLAVFLLAVSSWFLIQSRIGIPMILAVSVAVYAMWLAVATCQSNKTWSGLAGGIVLGLGAYTVHAFFPYFVGIWGSVAVAALISKEVRKSHAARWFLILSMIIAAPILSELVLTDYISERLGHPYYGGVSVFDIPRHVGRVVELALMVQNPINTGVFDGTGGVPLLHSGVTQLGFWTGLAIAVLKIKQRPFQMLLLGWGIAATTAVLTDEAESRRYLLGIFFLLVFVSIGFNVILQLAIAGVPKIWNFKSVSFMTHRRYAVLGGTALIASFAAYAFIVDTMEFTDWHRGGVRWSFEQRYVEVLNHLAEKDPNAQIRFYSVRRSYGSHQERLLVPSRIWVDGSEEFGGDGTIWSAGPINQPTIYILLEGYEDLIHDLRETFPNGVEHAGYDYHGDFAFYAYTVQIPVSP